MRAEPFACVTNPGSRDVAMQPQVPRGLRLTDTALEHELDRLMRTPA